ncbi:MAG: AIM24 family protein [Armatimonadetes bacterium]|nr:AIM24 family protein [Armatimonadota bacterium]
MPEADNVVTHTIADFVASTAEKDNPGNVFELESSRMLEAHVSGRTWSKLGSMVAYRGSLQFKREGMLEGGVGKALMKMVSGEMSPLVKIEGNGIAYLADEAKEVTILRLTGDSINVNGNDLLAFEDTVSYDITMHKRIAGMMSGGLFSVKLSGNGMVAIVSHGKPLTLKVSPNDPVFTDPNSTVAWSGNLTPELKSDINFKTLMGRGGGETFQMAFRGEGFVVVQPFEEHPAVQSTAR